MAKSIEAGRAVLKLTIDDKELAKKFAGLKRQVQNAARSIRSAGLQIGALGGAIVAPFALATRQFIKTGDELNKMSARTGVAVEALSELKFAAEQSGASLGDVEKGIKGMQRSLLDAELGLSTATDALELLGLDLEDLKGQKPEDQFTAIAEAVADIEDPSQRAAVSMKIFGRAGQVLQPMLRDMAALRKEARELGIVMSEEDAQAAADLADAFNRVKLTVVALALQVGAALGPALIDIATQLQEVVRGVVEFAEKNRTMVIVIASVGAGLLGLGTALVGIGAAMSLATIAATGLGTAFTFLARHPIVLVLAGIALVTVQLINLFKVLDDEVTSTGDKLLAVLRVTGIGGTLLANALEEPELRRAGEAERARATGSAQANIQDIIGGQAAVPARAQAVQERLDQLATSIPKAISTAPAAPNEAQKGMLKLDTIRNNLLTDILAAVQNGGGLTAGSF